MTTLVFKLFVFFCAVSAAYGNPLNDYINKDDGYYKYEVLRENTYQAPGVTTYMLNMTSQRWLSDAEVSRSVWWHYLIIHIPDSIDPELKNTGMLFVDGDDNSDEPPGQNDPFIELFRLLAISTQSITAVLKQIPNCRITFAKDPAHKSRSENEILAYSWKLFHDEPDRPELIVLFPMVKAAVKAMDAVTDFVNKTKHVQLENFCSSGASKRGWTAWITAAVDDRVKCLAPVVYDYLNMVPNLHHHYMAYGGWSFALEAFYDVNFTRFLDDKNFALFVSLTDPLAYKDHLKMPKMIVSSTGDEYFLPDDSHYYLSNMEGPTYVNMIPNAEHTCLGHEMQLLFNLEAFYLSTMKNVKLPKVSWTKADTATGGIIDVTTDMKPVLVRAWHTTTVSKTRRDFRLIIANSSDPRGKTEVQPVVWFKTEVKQIDQWSYSYEMDNPVDGWTAFFIQMTFALPNGKTFECTTETKVVPSTFPFPDCHNEECYGKLL